MLGDYIPIAFGYGLFFFGRSIYYPNNSLLHAKGRRMPLGLGTLCLSM